MNKDIRVLYVEDDITLAFLTRDNLERAGYKVTHCGDGIDAYEQITSNQYDLYILDVMLPKIDGYTLARKIRDKSEDAPIIFLSAKSTLDDKLAGLQLGADDYITKPFSIEELILKIEVFVKRSGAGLTKAGTQKEHQIGATTFSMSAQRLSGTWGSHDLTHREAALLDYFCSNLGLILKRDDILKRVWGNDHFFSSRSLDVFVSRLRKMLRDEPAVRIESIHNMGYRMLIEG